MNVISKITNILVHERHVVKINFFGVCLIVCDILVALLLLHLLNIGFQNEVVVITQVLTYILFYGQFILFETHFLKIETQNKSKYLECVILYD